MQRNAAHPFVIMTIFNVDLDNTLIYSYKHDIGTEKKCVEIYQGREISFMTEKTQEMLIALSRKLLLVPTTTRTMEQYERIQLGLPEIPYALVCNGGVLLVNGKEDETWYRESLERIKESNEELAKAERLLAEDPNICFEIRNIKDLFLFTKSSEPSESVKFLAERLDTSKVNVFSNGAKVYVVPIKLSKGEAVKRLKERLQAQQIIAAGDSEFDISMLEYADIAIAPEGLEVPKARTTSEEKEGTLIQIPKHMLFSEKVLEYVAGYIEKR